MELVVSQHNLLKMNKKAQGLSMNTIIIAVLVLVVLVILILIFSGKMGGFRRGINACDGTCVEKASDCGEDENPIYLVNCDDNGDGESERGNYCCISQT